MEVLGKLPGKYFPADRLIWLDVHGQGRELADLQMRHNLREQTGSYAWRRGVAVAQSPFVAEEVVATFRKKVISKV